MQENQINYWEVYYTSSQEGVQNQADGFGIRAFSEDLPNGILEELKALNIFYYESGNRSLPSSYELIDQPNLIYEYPKTIYYNRCSIGENTFFVLSRTVFIGRDYGWYLDEVQENARSGNTFTHALIFDQFHPEIFKILLLKDFFVPVQLDNNSNNQELKHLLTGSPPRIETRSLEKLILKENHLNNRVIPKGVFLTYLGLQENISTVIRTPDNIASSYLVDILALLPNCIKKDFLVTKTNYQSFFFDPETTIIFINEDYSNAVEPNTGGYFLDDLIQNISSEIPKSPFFNFLTTASFNDLQLFCNKIDYIIDKWSNQIDFEIIYIVFQFLFTKDQNEIESKDLLRALIKLDSYPLSSQFKKERNQIIISQLRSKRSTGDIKGVTLFLNLIEGLNIFETYTSIDREDMNIFLLKDHSFFELLELDYPLDSLFSFINSSALINKLSEVSDALKNHKSYFERFIIQLLSANKPEHANILYHTLNGELCEPAFYESLSNILNRDSYEELMERNQFFCSIGQEMHHKYMRKSVNNYIDNIIYSKFTRTKELFNSFEKILINENYSYFEIYSSHLTQKVITTNLDFEKGLLVLDHLSFLISYSIKSWEGEISEKGQKVCAFLLDNIQFFTKSNIRQQFYKILTELKIKLSAIDHHLVQETKESILILLDGIEIAENPQTLINYHWNHSDSFSQVYVSFILQNCIPNLLKIKEEDWQHLLINLHRHQSDYFEDSQTEENVVTYFSKVSNKYLHKNQSRIEDSFVLRFNLMYYKALYSIYPKGAIKSNTEQEDFIIKTVKTSLTALKKENNTLYRSIRKALSKELPHLYELTKEKSLFSKIKDRIIPLKTPRNETQDNGN